MTKLTDEELDRGLITILNQHVGKRQAINRWDLVEKIFGRVPQHLQHDDNIDDRQIRYAVSRLREEGNLICDLGNGNGRYLAANEGEFWELYAYYKKPIEARARVLRAMEKAAEEKWPDVLQMKMEM